MSNLYHHRAPAFNGMDIYPLVEPQHQHSPGHGDSIYQDSIDDVPAQGDFEAYGGATSNPINVEKCHDLFTGWVVDGHPNAPSMLQLTISMGPLFSLFVLLNVCSP